MPLPQRNQPVETFFLDRPHEPLRVRIRIRGAFGVSTTGCPRRRSRAAHHGSISDPDRRSTPAVRYPHPSSAIVSVRTICCMNSASGYGVDPRICTRRDAEIDDEYRVVRHEALPRPDFGGEEIRAGDARPNAL